MDSFCIPPVTTRRYVGQLRHINIFAAKVERSEVTLLANEVDKELVEVCFLPQCGETFTPHSLQTARIEEADLLQRCRELLPKVLSYFTKLAPSHAEWHTAVKQLDHGIVVTAIIGHKRSMLVAREHGLIL